jgi:DnaD/phage-associated family protein
MSRRLTIKYGNGVLSLPKESLLNALPSASEFYLKVLLLVAADENQRQDYDSCCAFLCEKLDCTQSALERAFAFWSQAGIFNIVDINQATIHSSKNERPATSSSVPATLNASSSSIQENKVLQSASPPEYTESQCADIVAASNDLPDLINICQQIVGKIFNPADVQAIVVMYDHLGLSAEYIADLFAFCVGNEKKSIRYIEKTAFSLFDEGIDTPDALKAYIKRKENYADNLMKIRKMIGAGSRELTAKEKKAFACWLDEWQFEIDVITRAYEITVDKINEPSVSYMNRVLENWYNSGLTTLEAIEASLETYKKNKAEAAHAASSVNGTESGFRTDEFFEAALRRSYKEKEKES